MKRREFLGWGVTLSAVAATTAKSLWPKTAFAADTLTAAQIQKEGQPAVIANYCEHPDKQPNKFCPDWKSKPGHCKDCTFFNKDNSLTTFKGGKFARCQLLADPKKPQFVSENGYCSTFVKKT
jgi:hypothetical protein